MGPESCPIQEALRVAQEQSLRGGDEARASGLREGGSAIEGGPGL